MKLIDERIMIVLRDATGALADSAIAAHVNRRWPPGFNNDSLYAALRRLKIFGELEKVGKGVWNLPGRPIGGIAIVPDDPEPPVPTPEDFSEDLEMMAPSGKTTVRQDALAHVAQAAKPAQPAAQNGSDLRESGGSARRRVPTAPSATREQEVKQKCLKCGGSDFTEGGNCRKCKKADNDAYRARQLAKTAAPKAAPEREAAPAPACARKDLVKRPATPIHFARLVQPVYMVRIKDSVGVEHDLFFAVDTIKQLAAELQEYL